MIPALKPISKKKPTTKTTTTTTTVYIKLTLTPSRMNLNVIAEKKLHQKQQNQ
jgi:hypothetical protein